MLWDEEANTSFTRILALRWDGGSTRAAVVVVRLAAGVVVRLAAGVVQYY